MKAIKQTALLTASNVVSKFLALVFFVIMARIFLPEEYGLFRYLLSLAMMLSIPLAGFPVAITKFISQYKNAQKQINRYFSNGIFIILNVFIVVSVFIFLLSQNKIFLWLIFLGISTDCLYYAIIRGFYNFRKIFLYRILVNLLKVILALIALFLFKIEFYLFIIFFVISGITIISLLELTEPTKIKFQFKEISKKQIKIIIAFALPVMLGSIGYDLMFNIDTILIKYFIDNAHVGFYNVARTLVQAYIFLPLAINTIVLPKTAYIAHNHKEKLIDLKKKLGLAFFGTGGISISIFFIFFVWGKWIINLLFTDLYISAYQPLLILGIAQTFFVIFLMMSAYWQGLGKPQIPSIIITMTCVLNIIGNYLLIPIYGINGAAISTTVTSVMAFLLGIIIFLRK